MAKNSVNYVLLVIIKMNQDKYNVSLVKKVHIVISLAYMSAGSVNQDFIIHTITNQTVLLVLSDIMLIISDQYIVNRVILFD